MQDVLKTFVWEFYSPLANDLNWVSSPMRMGGPMHAEIEDKTFFVVSIWWDAPESKIHASGEELMEINA
jgi:hypothetical protein